MTRAVLVITPQTRAKAVKWAQTVPEGSRVEFKAAKRTLAQSARMWAMLTDVATQLTWHGQRLTAEDWKLVFMHALDRETRFVPAIDGHGMVPLGRSSSDLSKQEMGELMDLIEAFGNQHGVAFHAKEMNHVER